MEYKIWNQGGYFENTLVLPQRVKYSHFAKASGLKNRLKAERAWFLSEEERGAKPETEHLLPRWGKSCVFLNSLARASLQTVFSTPILIPSYQGKKMLPKENQWGQILAAFIILIFSES